MTNTDFNEIDAVMNLTAEELIGNDKAIEAIITYHRAARNNFELGVKPKKDKGSDAPKVKLDLASLGLKKGPTVQVPIEGGGGIRRPKF